MSILELTTASGQRLPVTRFRAKESVSSLFSIEVWVHSTDAGLDLSAIAGRPATFRVVAGHAHALIPDARTFSGLVHHSEQVHAVPTESRRAGKSTYRFVLVPNLWRLSHHLDNRIFQHLSIPDIVEEVLRGWSIPHVWHIDRSQYPKLEYKVQYGESDYAFVARLLEEAGIAYTLVADAKGHSILTLSDCLEGGPRRPGPPLPYVDHPNEAAEREFVTGASFVRQLRPGALTVRDYDHRHPGLALFTQAQPVALESQFEQYHYDPGASLVETGKPTGTPVADDRGHARHDPAYAKALAERMLQGERVGAHLIELVSNAYDLAPGSLFSIANHPHDGLPASRRLLTLDTTFEGMVQGSWSLSVTAVPADIPYRPQRRTPKPTIHGVQSATVVGPAGQEIHTDEHGRVRVELPWDRAGHKDERSSCWVRVVQSWAGAGYGATTLPRIGQEVLLSFLEGDPDQPVIWGRVFNALEQVPYRLPEHQTRSTWKTDSSPKSDGFNEIMFEDRTGQELVWQQAQRDRSRDIRNNEFATVGRDRQTLVKHDGVEHTDGDRRRWVGKNADGVVKQDCRERIERGSHLEVRGDSSELVRGNQSLTVVGQRHERVVGRLGLRAVQQVHAAAEDIVGEGANDVTVKGPAGFVRIDASGVTIAGTLVKINVSGNPGKGRGCKPSPPEEPDLASTPAILNLRWSKPKVPVGDPVQAIFRVRHFKGNETALVKVFEHNADGTKKQVDEISVSVKKTDGDVKVKWTRDPDEAEGDLKEDEAEGDIGPLEYRFEVEAGSLRSAKSSGPLWLTNTVVIEALDEDGQPLADGHRVGLRMADGTRLRASTTNGQAVFKDVLVGPVEIDW